MSQFLYIALWLVGIIWTIFYLRNWNRVVYFFNTQANGSYKIPPESLEIICTFRNEEAELPRFLNNCQEILQQIPLQITLINDHSDDSSHVIILDHPVIQHPNFQIHQAPAYTQGKKACIAWAMSLGKSQHVLTTDADCELNANSLETLYHFHQKGNAHLSLGLMRFIGNKTALSQYQIIENSALVALSTYHANKQTPTMGNAANMILKRDSFLQIEPYKEHLQVAGGDDIFLIQAFQKAGFTVQYSNDIQTALRTRALDTWKELWHQRIRWAKKSQFQRFGETQKSQIIFVLYLLYLWGITLVMGFTFLYVLPLSCWLLKIGGETQFLGSLFQKIPEESKPKFRDIVLASFIQSFFIPLVALAQFFIPVRWKGRKI